jgi:hypothetical protein
VNNQPRKFDDFGRAKEEAFLEEDKYENDDFDSWDDESNEPCDGRRGDVGGFGGN